MPEPLCFGAHFQIWQLIGSPAFGCIFSHAQGGTPTYKPIEGAWRFPLNTTNASWEYVPGAESFVRFQSICVYIANGLDSWTQTPTVLMFGTTMA